MENYVNAVLIIRVTPLRFYIVRRGPEMDKYLRLLSQGDRLGLTLIRLSIAIVFIWIGLLKFGAPIRADSITPFVANSPFYVFFYEHRKNIVSI